VEGSSEEQRVEGSSEGAVGRLADVGADFQAAGSRDPAKEADRKATVEGSSEERLVVGH